MRRRIVGPSALQLLLINHTIIIFKMSDGPQLYAAYSDDVSDAGAASEDMQLGNVHVDDEEPSNDEFYREDDELPQVKAFSGCWADAGFGALPQAHGPCGKGLDGDCNIQGLNIYVSDALKGFAASDFHSENYNGMGGPCGSVGGVFPGSCVLPGSILELVTYVCVNYYAGRLSPR